MKYYHLSIGSTNATPDYRAGFVSMDAAILSVYKTFDSTLYSIAMKLTNAVDERGEKVEAREITVTRNCGQVAQGIIMETHMTMLTEATDLKTL